MYKLLLVSDQEDVLEAFANIRNWGNNGFNKPHLRSDLDGAKESLKKHHADGIAMALSPDQEKELLAYLQEEYPLVPIFEAGRTTAEAEAYLGELRMVLNRLRADFASDSGDEHIMMLRARRHFFRRLVSGKPITQEELYRRMRLLRSRMDPDRPCILVDLEQSSLEDDRLVGRWQDSDYLLERELFQSFGGDVKGYHVLPLVTEDGRVFVLAGALRDQPQEEDMATTMNECIREGISHAEEYRGIHLRMKGMQILASLYAFCSDYTG